MGEIYIEENHAYQIDLRRADWFMELHSIYRSAHLDLADVDYICEIDGKILLIEQQFTAFKPLAHRPKPMLAKP